MKTIQIWLFIGIILVLVSCQDTTEPDSTQVATFEGTVYALGELGQPLPLSDVLVTAKGFYKQTTTNTEGKYEISVEPEAGEETVSLELEFSKVGYRLTFKNVEGLKGERTKVPDVTMQSTNDDSSVVTPPGGESDDAAHIEIYGSHESHIYVRSSGLTEAAIVQFVVTDARGRRVDENHKVLVHFSILNGPNGGEYLFPDTMTTQAGFVHTVLNSGYVSGTVQLIASFEVNGKEYRTLPVRLAIWGGLPDQEHFSVALDRVNIAGHVHSGILDPVTAYVGDKFGNPVAPGTAVYFYSDYGILEGSAITDEMGRATVRYMSAQPLPPNPAEYSLAEITATTYGDTLKVEQLSSSTKLLLTGPTAAIQISPETFTYTDVNQPVSFDYTVSDIWGYPLVKDTRIKITASDGNLYGDTDIKMLDTQASGPGRTEFNFAWAPGDSLEAPQVYISIRVTTPEDGNGYQSANVVGTKQ